jgi:hypothetical protein
MRQGRRLHDQLLSHLRHPWLEFKIRIDCLLVVPDLRPQPRIGYSRERLQSPESLEPFLLVGWALPMVHNSIKFSVQEREAGVWRWEYTIGQLIKSGQLMVSSRATAFRKVRQQIDRDLRILYRSQRDRGIQF